MFLCQASWMCLVLHGHRRHDPTSESVPRATLMKKYCELDETISAKNSVCSICLEGYGHSSSVMVLPCGHVLHATCGRRWLKDGHACPFRCSPPIHEAPENMLRRYSPSAFVPERI